MIGSANLNIMLKAARKAGVPEHSVRDAGRTEVEPGSRTVLALGPARTTEARGAGLNRNPERDSAQHSTANAYLPRFF